MKKRSLWKTLFIGIITLIVCFVIGIGLIWHDEISSVFSIQCIRERNDSHMDGAVYTMHVNGGFYLEDFIAQGGVSNDTELIEFVTNKITKGIIDIGFDAPEIACSSFTAKTSEGDVLFARNYDFSKTNACIVFTEATEGRHATISTVDLQFLGINPDTGLDGLMDKITCLATTYIPFDGINDAGVSCGIYMTYQGAKETIATDQNTDKPDITSSTLLRLILDYADSVEDAVEIASSYDLHDSAQSSYHYMVADASGTSAILEWVTGTDMTDNDGTTRELKVTYNYDDISSTQENDVFDYQVVTNFIIQPGYYDESPDEDKKGYDRYEKIYETLYKTGGILKNDTAAMNILELVGRRKWDNDDANCCTVHSAVYNLTERTVLWVSNENYDDPTAVFKFKFDN